jgi:acyl carrier protein
MDTREAAIQKMAEVLGQKPESISDDAVLTSLVNSSFVLVEMVIELQEEFGVRFQQADLNGITTVGQLIALIESRVAD